MAHGYISNLLPHFPLLLAMITTTPYIHTPYPYYYYYYFFYLFVLWNISSQRGPNQIIKPDPANFIACAYERPRHKSTRVAPQTRPTTHLSLSLYILPYTISSLHTYIYILKQLPTLLPTRMPSINHNR